MTINCRGNLIDLSEPKIMGIINITPDSFFSGSRTETENDILKKAEQMLTEGADFLDVGGYSSRPGAEDISVEAEVERVIPVIELLLKNFPDAILSIDTFRSKVAEESIEAGAHIINDISAGSLDKDMMPIIAKFQVPYIMMHMKGTPQTMKELNQYDDLIQEILFYFSEKVRKARDLGINDLIIDPGFGFAKNIQQNFNLLSSLEAFKILELPILAGLSRKSLIYKTFNTTAENALNGTTVLNTISLQKGANILRVHDVKEAAECVKLLSRIKK
ncbi:dihydropteroate synthase [Salegentibacter sp. F188]|uniref:dihydropteroate synthase n=1 Tax=Autumnicola patrickiae TaxID=3075591 RepID=A0ABU3E523_9FLAO|nr:dihydropteroate synthase [Salegentibacter sp. F188]MDT0691081.1 dihydropteroate synthase [Salegentibacter sp. F188]